MYFTCSDRFTTYVCAICVLNNSIDVIAIRRKRLHRIKCTSDRVQFTKQLEVSLLLQNLVPGNGNVERSILVVQLLQRCILCNVYIHLLYFPKSSLIF